MAGSFWETASQIQVGFARTRYHGWEKGWETICLSSDVPNSVAEAGASESQDLGEGEMLAC